MLPNYLKTEKSETARKSRHEMSSTVSLHLYSDGSSICYSSRPVWPWTVTFWPQNLTHASLPHNMPLMQAWWKSKEYFSRHRVNKAQKALFPTYFIPLWPRSSYPKLWQIHLCPIMHYWCKLGENVTNTLQNIVLTFQDAYTDEQDKTMSHVVWPLTTRHGAQHGAVA